MNPSSRPDLDIRPRLESIYAAIAAAAERSGRPATEITLVGVSKSVDRGAVEAAYAAGLRAFGENRVQDAAAKFAPPLPPDARLHLIGQLQTNKAKAAVPLFDAIESVDRSSLIAALQSAASARDRRVSILLQVNIAREPQKAGCSPEDAAALVESILAAPSLALEGLMTIAPLAVDPETVRPVFAGLRELRQTLGHRYPELQLGTLSMGMSNDFGIAIEEGATHVRVGRALFQG